MSKLGAIFQIGLTDWIDVDFSRWGSVAESENRLFGVYITNAVKTLKTEYAIDSTFV